MSTYNYSLATNFGGSININRLYDEINANGTITQTLTSINVNADVVSISFDQPLSGGGQTALNAVVSGHDSSAYIADENAVRPVKITTSDPTTGNDEYDGFEVGSQWFNTNNDKMFICLDNTPSSAVWKEVTQDAHTSASSGVHGVSGTVVGTSDTQTLTNKTFTDNVTTFQNSSDNTKKARFGLSGIQTGTTRTLQIPNFDTTIVGTDTTQTLTNKSWGDNLDMNGNRIVDLAEPVADTDAATKKYVDSVASGLDFKDSVKVASTEDLNSNSSISGSITYNATGGAKSRGQITATLVTTDQFTLDGVNLSSSNNGTRILLKDQSSGAQNGIWTTTISGTSLTLDRSTDYDDDNEVTSGAFCFIEQGSTHGDQGWVLTTNDPIVIGGSSGTSLSYVQFTGAGNIIAGNGLIKTDNTIDAVGSSTIVVSSDSIAVNSSNTANQVLLSSGSVGTPATYGAVPLGDSNAVTGTLPINRGGTNATSYTAGDRIIATNSGNTALTTTSIDPSTVVLLSGTQTLTNKTFTDTSTYFQDDVDNTKKFQFQLSGITTATTRTVTIPDGDTTLVGTALTQTLTNKTISASSNTISNIANANISASAGIDATKIADGSVTNAEFQYINSLTSNAQTQLDAKIPYSEGNLINIQNGSPGDSNHVCFVVTKNHNGTDTYNLGVDSDPVKVIFSAEDGTYRQATVFSADVASATATIFGVSSSGNSGSSWNPRFVICQDGKIGVGTNAPSQILDVQGNIAVTGTVDGRDISTDGSSLDSHISANTAHGVSGTLVGTSDTQTLTNKTMVDASTTFQDDLDNTKKFQFQASGVTSGQTRTYSVPDGDTTLVGTALTQTLTNKTISASNNTISNIGNASIASGASIDASKIADGSVSSTQFQYLSGASSNIQTQINNHTSATTAHGVSGTLVGTSDIQTLTNKTLTDSNSYLQNNGDNTKKVRFDLTSVSTGTTRVISLPNANTTLVGNDNTVTLTNKTFTDNSTYFQDDVDNTKKMQFELSGVTTSTTRTLTVPDANTTLVGTDATQILTNKTISASSNTISNIANANISSGASIDATKIADGSVSSTQFQYLSGATSNIQTQINNHTSASSAHGVSGSLVGTSDTQTLTNKTFTDSTTYFQDNVDTTKKLQFELSGITTSTTRTLTVPNANTTLVGTDATQTLTNKTINATNNTISNIANTHISATAGIDATKIADGSVTSTAFQYVSGATSNIQGQINTHTSASSAHGVSGSIVGTSDTQTMTNKTFTDNSTYFQDNTDNTKKLQFELSGITTSTTRTLTIPNANTTLVGTDATQTLTNKTLTTPIISQISNTGTLTLPTSTDTLVGRATTDILTNKTLTSPVISTIVNTGTLTLPTSTDTLVGRATTDTLTNKTLTLPTISSISNSGTISIPTGTDTLVGRATTDTLTNKSLNNTSVLHVDNADNTKKIGFSSSGATTSTTLTLAGIQTTNRTITFPDATDTVVTLTATQTLTNKTLTTPVISQISNTGTLTLPTSTDTLVGRATTDTLTNKTLTTPIISQISNTGTLTLPTSTDTLVGRATTDTLTNKSLNASSCLFVDNAVNTKKIGFSTSGATSSTTLTLAGIQTTNRTITFPDATDTVVTLASTQTMTNKTLTAPIISSISNTGTLTLPTSTDTLVGRATTDTLTNKTWGDNLNMNNNKITNLGTPTANTDAATKGYVDGVVTGLDFKASVIAASTVDLNSNSSISGSITYNATAGTSGRGQITATLLVSNTFTVDGVTFTSSTNGSRILLKNQSTGAQNGIWTTTVSGTSLTLDRATDFDQDAEVTAGAFCFVEQGTTNADSGWVLATDNPITIGGASGTSLSFTQFSGGGSLTAGAGLTKTGNTLDVGGSATIIANADTIEVNSSATANQVLLSSGSVGVASTFGALPLSDSNAVSGTLPIARGGTNSTTYTAGNRIIATNSGNTALVDTSLDPSTVVTTTSTSTMTNKTFTDSSTYFQDDSDNSKKMQFQLSGITVGTTRTLTVPDLDTILVGTNAIQTLTNKTLTTPVISTISNTGTITLPTSTDTLVGRATTDTLTNKSLNNASVFHVDNADNSKKLGFSSSGATTGTTLTLAGTQTTNKTITFPDITDTVVTLTATQTLTNKTINASNNTISNIANANIATGATIDATKIANGTVTSTQFQYLSGATSNIQAQINAIVGGSSQWVTTGSDIYYTTGNVAMGHTTPGTARVYVRGFGTASTDPWLRMEADGTTDGGVIQYYNSGVTNAPALKFSDYDDPSRIEFQQIGSGSEASPQYYTWFGFDGQLSTNMRLEGGNFGIGKTPDEKLDVSGNVRCSNYVYIDTGESSVPSIPSTGAKIFVRSQASRRMVGQIGPNNLDYAFQPFLATNKIGWWSAQGNSTTVNVFNYGNTTTGTATSRSVATTNLFTSMRRIGYVSTTTAGASAGTRHNLQQFFIGNGSTIGGFFYCARFGLSVNQPTQRVYIGFIASTSVIGNVEPSTLTNIIGFGSNSTDTEFFFYHNDSSGTATKETLGASFPANTANADMYEIRIFCPPNGTTVSYSMKNLVTDAFIEGTVSSDLPANTQLLATQIWTNNGTTAGSVGIDVVSQYIELDN